MRLWEKGACRFLDVLLALAAAAAGLVWLPFLALLLWVETGSVPFFFQRRSGRWGERLFLPKLRTLRRGLKTGRSYQEKSLIGPLGRLVRAARWDELPQLVWILTGKMSWVGPRPLLEEHLRACPEDLVSVRRRTVPGILGPAQLHLAWHGFLEIRQQWFLEKHIWPRMGFPVYVSIIFEALHALGSRMTPARLSFPGRLRRTVREAKRRLGSEMLRMPSSRAVWAKMEGCQPTGSMKDRAALAYFQSLAAQGTAAWGDALVESSSGNFAAALSLLCRESGLAFHAFVDSNLPGYSRAELLRRGTILHSVPGGAQDGLTQRLNGVHAFLDSERRSRRRVFWPNQYENETIAAAYGGIYREFKKEQGSAAAVLVPVSTGGTLWGIAGEARKDGAVIVAVDQTGSVLGGGRKGERRFPGFGSSRPMPLAEKAGPDFHICLEPAEIEEGWKDLVQRCGVRAGASSGAVWAAWLRLEKDANGFNLPDGPVLLVFPDNLDRYEKEWRNIAVSQ